MTNRNVGVPVTAINNASMSYRFHMRQKMYIYSLFVQAGGALKMPINAGSFHYATTARHSALKSSFI